MDRVLESDFNASFKLKLICEVRAAERLQVTERKTENYSNFKMSSYHQPSALAANQGSDYKLQRFAIPKAKPVSSESLPSYY